MRCGMNIKLTPEIERVLIEIAEKQGATAELLAIRTLRECFFSERNRTGLKNRSVSCR